MWRGQVSQKECSVTAVAGSHLGGAWSVQKQQPATSARKGEARSCMLHVDYTSKLSASGQPVRNVPSSKKMRLFPVRGLNIYTQIADTRLNQDPGLALDSEQLSSKFVCNTARSRLQFACHHSVALSCGWSTTEF